MENESKTDQKKGFYLLLFQKTALPILSIVGVSLLYIAWMSFVNHQAYAFPYLVLVLALIKTLIISKTTLNQLTIVLQKCHSVERLLGIFGLIIFMSILSFATDYTCLFQMEQAAFHGVPEHVHTYLYNLYHFFYFSFISFSTVGFGDIAPVSGIARFIVMLEVSLSYFIVVFALANVRKMHIKI